jgi:hypothetical protein
MGVKAGTMGRVAGWALLALVLMPNMARADSRIPWWEYRDIVREYDCARVATEYGMKGRSDFGFAPDYVQNWYTANWCNTAPEVGDVCLAITRNYAVNSGVSWGYAPTAVRDWWSAHGCNTQTTRSTSQAISDNFAVDRVAGDWGFAPGYVHQWYTWQALFGRFFSTRPSPGLSACQLAAEKYGIRSGWTWGWAPDHETPFSINVQQWWMDHQCDASARTGELSGWHWGTPWGVNRGQTLAPGQYLSGALNDYLEPFKMTGTQLFMQEDCNLVVYQAREVPFNTWETYFWASWSQGQGNDCYAVMQTDGNFVVYNGAGHVWDSGTQGNPGAHLEMQGDGNLVIYRTDGSHAWDSGTTFTPDTRAWSTTQPPNNCQFLRTDHICIAVVDTCGDVWLCPTETGGTYEWLGEQVVCGVCPPIIPF